MTLPALADVQSYTQRPLAVGEQALQTLASSVASGQYTAPVMSHWDMGSWTPDVWIEALKKGEYVAPAIRLTTGLTAESLTASHVELLALLKDRNMPLILRCNNLEEHILALDGGAIVDDWDDSGLVWGSDYSDGLNYRGTIDASGSSPISLPADGDKGDFWIITGISGSPSTRTFGSSNAITGSNGERLVAKVDSASSTDANDWEICENRLSPMGGTAAWTAAGNAYNNTYLQAVLDAYPNPPLVVVLSNNEAPKVSYAVRSTDHKFTVAYSATHTNNTANAQMRQLWTPLYQALQTAFTNVCQSRQNGWDKIKFVAYQVDGTDNATGIRFNASNTDVLSYVDGSYGYERDKWDGSADEWYINGDAVHDIHPRASMSLQQWKVWALDYARNTKADWINGISVYPSGGTIYNCQTNGDGEITPVRHAGYLKFVTFLMRPQILLEFQNNSGTGLDAYKLTDAFLTDQGTTWVAYSATHSLATRWTDRDYWQANLDATALFHADDIKRVMQYELASQPTSLELPINFLRQSEILGPYASEPCIFLMDVDENPDFSSWTVNTEPIWALCRRDGNGKGCIYAWDPKGGPTDCTVNTPDGSFDVNATVQGTFYLYDGVTVTSVEENTDFELETEEVEAP